MTVTMVRTLCLAVLLALGAARSQGAQDCQEGHCSVSAAALLQKDVRQHVGGEESKLKENVALGGKAGKGGKGSKGGKRSKGGKGGKEAEPDDDDDEEPFEEPDEVGEGVDQNESLYGEDDGEEGEEERGEEDEEDEEDEEEESIDFPFCRPGNRDKLGGQCSCIGAPGWTKDWQYPWCYEGNCYSGIADARCIGNTLPGMSLDDGTWCHYERRDTECPTTPSDPPPPPPAPAAPDGYKVIEKGMGWCADGDDMQFDAWYAMVDEESCASYCDDSSSCKGFNYGFMHCVLRYEEGEFPSAPPGTADQDWNKWEDGNGHGLPKQVHNEEGWWCFSKL